MNDKIVISGMSCRFPESDSYQVFWDNLLSHKDMVTSNDSRWHVDNYNIPKRFGKIRHPEYFDATFFGVHNKQAERMDPQLRLLLEVSYEAFLDAGIDPEILKGTKTGVFIGACLSDAQAIYLQDLDLVTGYENSGCSLSMFANRLSFFYDFHGPSQTIDTACSSSLVAFDAAHNAIKNGLCDYAIVGGANMIFHPAVSEGFNKLKMLSPVGACKSFDIDADGYVRSEGIGAIIISRQSLANRVRATVLGSAINSDGYTDNGITFPSGEAQFKLLTELYEQCDIDLADIKYIEAHGTGTAAGDPQELQALDNAFALNKRDASSPLLIGSVKSNMGHAESAAGIAGIIKVLLTMEHNTIPANLHFSQPNDNIQSLVEKRIKIIDENHTWEGGIVGINSFGFGGTNAHIILQGGQSSENNNRHSDRLPITPFSVRSKSGLEQVLNDCVNTGITSDARALLQDIANRNSELFPYRGCITTSTDGENTFVKSTEICNQAAPVWFVFPGMGSQWPGMGSDLMVYPVFKTSIVKSQQELNSKNINILSLINKDDNGRHDNPSYVFCAIIAIQIALIDLLKEYGIVPDGMIGHSVGEIACGYADGALTQKQAILSAYYRGISIQECPTAAGKMAVATMSWEDAQKLSKYKIVAACHNSKYSVTLSGDAVAIDNYALSATNSGGNLKVVDSTGIAFHSPHIAGAEPQFKESLKDLIDKPKLRSERWISTSRPESEWENATYCSADYFADNLVNPVHFYAALKKVPENAIVIEIGPHSLMRTSIVDTVSSCHYINFMRRDHNSEQVFLDAIAQCYAYGLDIKWPAADIANQGYLNSLSICPATAWEHSKEWNIPVYSENSDQVYRIDLKNDEYAFISDHKINEKIIFPGVGYLYLIWTMLAKLAHKTIDTLKVQFTDVRFHRATIISEDGHIDLIVRYLTTAHTFEIVERDELVVTGKVLYGDEIKLPTITPLKIDLNQDYYMSSSDIYKELGLRGYNYGPAFQRIDKISFNGNHISSSWDNNWITFLDSLLQSDVVRHKRDTLIPTFIRSLTIDPTMQAQTECINSYSDQYIRRIHSNAVVVEDFEYTVISPVKQKDQPKLTSLEFIPYIQNQCIDTSAEREFISGYVNTVRDYVLLRFNELIENAAAKKLELPEHIMKLQSTLSKCQYDQIQNEDIERYINHPKAIYFRLAKYVYDNAEELLLNPMPTIVTFEEYNQLYKDDLSTSYLFKDRNLGSAIQTVMQNLRTPNAINICEVGIGTGGITAHILPMLRSNKDRYTCTDISSGFFDNLKDEFSAYQSVIEYAPWDILKQKPKQLENEFDLVVASNVIHAAQNIREALTNILDSLTEGGFMLLHEVTHGYPFVLGVWGFIKDLWSYNDAADRSHGACLSKERWIEILNEVGFDVVSVSDDGHMLSLYLCRKRMVTQVEHVVHNIKSISLELPEIQLKLKTLIDNPHQRLWLQGTRNDAPGLLGLVNCIRNETGCEQIRSLFVDDGQLPNISELNEVYNNDLFITVLKDGKRGGYYNLNISKNDYIETDNAYIDIGITGDLSTLQWLTSPEIFGTNYTFETYYSALNFKDVMLASGKLAHNISDGPMSASFGGEFSGVSIDGQRVMGFLNDPWATTNFRADLEVTPNVWQVPDTWSLEEAATVPVVYMTAYLALIVHADIKPGQRILIHSGTGGVGQAAIRIALAEGCEVFTTIGTQEKRGILKSIFPELLDTHIYSSRNTDFEASIMQVTKGQGVDVVLNSLADDKLQASIRALSNYGTFLEIGKYDMAKNTHIGMAIFLKNIRFIGVGLDNIMRNNLLCLEKVSVLVAIGIKSGVVVPLNRTVFNHDQLEDAFRYISKGKHTGKVLIKIKNETAATKTNIVARPKYWCNRDKSYLVTGGLGGIGFELIHWLISRGAKHITITSRSPIKNNYQKYWLNLWKKEGVDITVSNILITNKKQTKKLIEDMQANHPIGGVFHLAMVMEDAFFVNQNTEKFNKVVDIKYTGCINLDKYTRQFCPDLDHFVMFSSLAGSYGNPGQSSYGYANSAMDNLCKKRKEEGYPALSIQWGVIGDVGFVIDNINDVNVEAILAKKQSLKSCLDVLDNYLNQDKCIVTSHVPYCDIFTKKQGNLLNLHSNERTEESLIRDIKNIIGIPLDTLVDDETKLISYGVDSLMNIEIVGILDKDYDIRLASLDIQYLSFGLIKEMFNNRNKQDNIHELKINKENVQLGHSKEETVFELLAGNPVANNIVYFVNGFAVDSQVLLRDIKCPKDNGLYLVRFENTDNMNSLADIWDQHIRQMSVNATTINIVGHSIGATIVHRLKYIKDFTDLKIDMNFTSISAPKIDLYNHLINNFPLNTIDETPEELCMSRLNSIPWYREINTIGSKYIINQVKFILNDHFYNKSLSEVDRIILPKEDSICWDIDEAQQFSNVVLEVEGMHDARTVELDTILFET